MTGKDWLQVLSFADSPQILAACHCLGLSFFFVASLYVWHVIPGMSVRSRNDFVVIRCRIISVVFVCLVSPLYVAFVIPGFVPFPVQYITMRDILNTLISLGLTMLWFLGPLLQYHYSVIGQYLFYKIRQQKRKVETPHTGILTTIRAYYFDISQTLASFLGIHQWRNVIVAPWGEEWVFRALMIPLLLFGGFHPFWAAFVAPLFFGVAHIHHIFHAVTVDGIPLSNAILGAVFQFAYTTIFGWYSAYLYIHTSTVLAPAIAHTFCNSMGFPDFGGINTSPNSIKIKIAYVFGLSTFLVLLAYPNLTFV